MKNLAKEGKSIILITHKLKEIKESADRVTVIRRGKTIGTVDVADADDEQLAEMMVGRHVTFDLQKNKPNVGETVLSVKDLKVKDPRGPLAVKGLSFDVHAGEILGIAGIDGNGQTELVDAINGLRKVDSGKITILGKDMTNKRVREITELGVSYVPADRQRFGLILPLSLTYNLALKSYYQKPFANHGFLNEKAFADHAERLIKTYDVRAHSRRDPASALSGGNQQKAIIARELDLNSKLVVIFQPTRGLDVGAIEAIHKQILAERDAGRAILLISFELDEILQLSDRIIVLHDGEISGEVDPAKTNERELGLLMTGSHLNKKEEGTNVD
jgi:simple sugar transport system ATP-binding protein